MNRGADPRGNAAAVTIEGLRVVRGGKLVIHGFDIAVAAGRITGVLGPSGSGKSTLLRSIVGVQRVAGGTVRVLGRPAGSADLRRRVCSATLTFPRPASD